MPLLLALAAAFLFTAAAQVDEYRLKAAFLYNFTKFVDWPSEAPRRPDEPIAICVLGRNPFGNVLSETIAGKVVGLRTLTVREVSDSKQVDGCSILFVSASADKHFRSIAKTLSGAAILSVGEADGFTAEGGIITLKLENGNIRLEINEAAAERAHLRISSKLLALAHVVRRAP